MNSAQLLRSIDDLPDHEVRRLLEAATDLHWTTLILGADLADDDVAAFNRLVGRRRTGEPLQYIEGAVPFGPITVRSDPRALIPRPETEQLFELACGAVDDPKVIVDLCTGSGNLAIALKHTFPDAAVYATDRSAAAVELAVENARQAALDVTILVGDLFDPLPGHLRDHVDLIVANPPYLAIEEWPGLPPEVRDHEPMDALVAGPIGDELLVRIARGAGEWLGPAGVVACEISEFHGPEIARHFDRFGGTVHRDLSGKDRFVIGAAPQ